MRLLVATTNPGKIGEYQALLDGLNLQVVGLRQVEIDFDVEETGASFEENAQIKARAYADASGLLTLADDSGLCVDALDGAPGIYSARYGPTEHARIERLLGELQGVPDERRTARFGCVVALVLLGLNEPMVVTLSEAKSLGTMGGMLRSAQHDKPLGYFRRDVLAVSALD